jgi:hypothetical protein
MNCRDCINGFGVKVICRRNERCPTFGRSDDLLG